MRFSTTPARVKSFAGHLRRALPALSHSICLDAVSRAAGFRDWHELQSSAVSSTGTALPLRLESSLDTLGFADEELHLDELMEQLLDGLKGYGNSPPFFVDQPSDTTIRRMTGKLLFWSGLATCSDGDSLPRKWRDQLPSGDSVFYELARTTAFDKREIVPTASMGSYIGGDILEVVVGPHGELPAHVDRWLTSVRTTPKAKAQLLATLQRSPEQLRFDLAQQDSINRSVRMLLSAGSTLHVEALVLLDVQLFTPRHEHTAVAKVCISGLFDESDEERLFQFGSSIATEVEDHWFEPLVWAMYGSPSPRLEVHIGTIPFGSSKPSSPLRTVAETTASLLYDGDVCARQWEHSPSSHGLHFYRGPGVSPLRSALGNVSQTHLSRLFS